MCYAETADVEADTTDEKAAVSVRGVRKSYGATQAVKGVDLQLQLGRITALLGHNGAGKSTLVSVITGPHGDFRRPMHRSPAHSRARHVVGDDWGMHRHHTREAGRCTSCSHAALILLMMCS